MGVRDPRSRTSQNRAPEPPFEQSATSAPSTWLLTQDPRSCWAALITRCSCCALIPGWLNDMVPPSVVTGSSAAGPDVPVLDERAALARWAEAEGLELPDDLEREGIVELGHVDIAGREAGHREGGLRRAGAHETGRKGVGAGLKVPHRGHDVGRPERIAGPAEDPHGCRAVTGTLGRGQDEGASTLGRGGAVQEMERVGNHPRGQDVSGRERSASVVDGFGVGVAVVADDGGDGGQLLGRGAVGEHVPSGHERELGCGEQPVSDDELVGRSRPRRRRGPIHVDTGAAGGNEDHLALAGGDEGRGIEEGGDPHLAGPSGTRSEAQFEDDLCAVGPDHAVDVARGDAGVGQRTRARPMRAMEVESCSGRTRACTVLWTPTMATPAKGCDD